MIVIDAGKCGGAGCGGHVYELRVENFAYTAPTDGQCENCMGPGPCGLYADFVLCAACLRAATIGVGAAESRARFANAHFFIGEVAP